MELARALDFARQHSQGVLTTMRRDGRPQLSNIVYGVSDDGTIRISVTDSRAKTRNIRRDPRVSLWVDRGDFWGYVVLDCDATTTDVVTAPDDPVADMLVAWYRGVRGEDHPNWDEYRAAMVTDRRLMLELTPTHAYGMLPRD